MKIEEALGGDFVEDDNIFSMAPIKMGALARIPEFARGGWERGDPTVGDCMAIVNVVEPDADADRFAQIEAAMPDRRDEFSRWVLDQTNFLPSLDPDDWAVQLSRHLWKNHGVNFLDLLEMPAALVKIFHEQSGRRGLKAGSKN